MSYSAISFDTTNHEEISSDEPHPYLRSECGLKFRIGLHADDDEALLIQVKKHKDDDEVKINTISYVDHVFGCYLEINEAKQLRDFLNYALKDF